MAEKTREGTKKPEWREVDLSGGLGVLMVSPDQHSRLHHSSSVLFISKVTWVMLPREYNMRGDERGATADCIANERFAIQVIIESRSSWSAFLRKPRNATT